jgi:putative addiction module killer protein
MAEVRETEHYRKWFDRLRDERARARIDARVLRLSLDIFGDVKSVGDGVSELRIDYGPGYRLYFTRRGDSIVILLCGGDKDSQSQDIAKAKNLAETV